jgi:hypothetical protein
MYKDFHILPLNYIAKAKKATTQSTTLFLISNVCFSNFMRKVFFVILVLIIYMYLLYIYKGVDVVECIKKSNEIRMLVHIKEIIKKRTKRIFHNIQMLECCEKSVLYL